VPCAPLTKATPFYQSSIFIDTHKTGQLSSLPLTPVRLRALLIAALLVVNVREGSDGPGLGVLAGEVVDNAHPGLVVLHPV